MQVAVLSPRGRDDYQDFSAVILAPDAPVHKPLNFHAYAACTGGLFCTEVQEIPENIRSVIVLLASPRKLPDVLEAMVRLRALGKTIAVSWKECGTAQVAEKMAIGSVRGVLTKILNFADGALSATPDLLDHYRAHGAKHTGYVPTPYPLERPEWRRDEPLAARKGILIGTREWGEPTRRHREALREAVATGAPVTAIGEGGLREWWHKREFAKAPITWLPFQSTPDYLALIAQHRVVFQRDAGATPGQVAGEALLCGTPCLGGNSAIEREVFDPLPSLDTLLSDDAAWAAAMQTALQKGMDRLSFEAGARRLAEFFQSITAA